jgi:FkbM family methyltransferase
MRTSEDLQRAFGFLLPVEVPVLKHLAMLCPPNPIVINIGAGVGTSAMAFLEARDDLIIYTVDMQERGHPLGGLENERTALADAGLFPSERHHQIHGDSAVVGKTWDKGAVDLVFVDGDHTTEGVEKDIFAWLPNIRPGGIIAFHDVGERWSGGDVLRAIEARRGAFSAQVCRVSLIQAFYTLGGGGTEVIRRERDGGANAQDLSFVAYYPEMAEWLKTSEPETWKWCEDHVGQDWTCIDGGAHVGMYTLLFAEKAPKGLVIGVEACPETAGMLRQNIAYNARFNYRHLGHVRLLRKALGDKTGQFKDRLWFTGHTPPEDDAPHDFVRLDGWGSWLPRLDLLKTDVDGWDLEALRGSEGLVKRFRPIILSEINYALEWRGHTLVEAERLMAEWGYDHRVLDHEMWLCWPREDAGKRALCTL